jgi:hypothetical protein
MDGGASAACVMSIASPGMIICLDDKSNNFHED